MHKIEKEKVKDTNGAGDTFLGGFFAHLIQYKSIHSIFVEGKVEMLVKAIEFGNKAASLNVQVDGCGFPVDTNWVRDSFDFNY